MNREKLNKILDLHKKWLKNKDDGVRADLSGMDLRGVDLSYANLSGANLRGAILICADLGNADLSEADLNEANLSEANLKCADLNHAKLYWVRLSNANLAYADLSGVNLNNADLSNANLRDVDLVGAELTWTKTQDLVGFTCISVQVHTSRKNNLITFWKELGIVTTGCFQGTMRELKEQVEAVHGDSKLGDRYRRAIAFIEVEE